MSKRKVPSWAGIPGGAALSLGLYILLQCLLALLTVQDMLDPAAALRLQIGSATLAALCGGVLRGADRSGWASDMRRPCLVNAGDRAAGRGDGRRTGCRAALRQTRRKA